jgi:hypothetical protein
VFRRRHVEPQDLVGQEQSELLHLLALVVLTSILFIEATPNPRMAAKRSSKNCVGLAPLNRSLGPWEQYTIRFPTNT